MAIILDDLRAFANLPASNLVPDSTLQLFVDIANIIRVEDFSTASLSPGRLDMIELNLAAHFAVVSQEYGGLTSQTVGTSEERYHIFSDKLYGLASTRFGQQALALDTSGVLSTMTASPLKALFRVVGDPPLFPVGLDE